MIQSATAKGQRPYQEDAFNVCTHPDGELLAVFDGHGGANCSTYLREHFAGKFIAMYEEQFSKNQKVLDAEWRRKLRIVIKTTFRELASETKEMTDGSTASIVWIPRVTVPEAAVAIIGDSPVFIGTKKGAHISPEHNARSNMKERKAAEKRGAFYGGGYLCTSWNGPGLQMSRALGDRRLTFLSQTPEIYFKPVRDFVLVATDGILDPGHTNTEGGKVVDLMVDAIRDGCDAKQLVATAVDDLKTGDNVTAILWRP